ncbi:adhesion G protein-coupled receptor E4P [Biomphalaria glabrata]|nr:adhesion G protein-coupled receptor E4P [Biomphalaria glabrata]
MSTILQTIVSLLLCPFVLTICPLNGEEPEFETFIWNKTQVSMLDYLHGYCQVRCQGETRIDLSTSSHCWNIECLPCYCQRPACEIYDNCCPDISVSYLREGVPAADANTSKLAHAVPSKEKQSKPRVQCERIIDQETNYMFVTSCPADYVENQTVVDLCERALAPEEQTIDTFLRVVDMTTHVIYKNMFCARCNHVTDSTTLPTTITAKHYSTYYKATSLNEMLRFVLKDTVKLYISFPENITLFQCVPYVSFSRMSQVFNTCGNALNEFKNDLDQDYFNACNEMPGGRMYGVYNRDNGYIFKNVYCAICNMEHCLRLQCAPGKMFHNGTCVEIIEEITGLSYQLVLWLVPFKAESLATNDTSTFIHKSSSVIDAILLKVEYLLHGFTEDFQVQVESFQSNSSGKVNLDIYWLHCKIVAYRNVSRNEFEHQILEHFLEAPLMMVNNTLKTETLILETLHVTRSPFAASYQLSSKINSTLYRSRNVLFSGSLGQYINITLLLHCRYVHFESRLFKMNVDYRVLPPNVKIKIDLFVTTIYITDQRDLKMVDVDEDGGLNVCVELLDKLIGQQQQSFLSLMAKWLKGTDLVEYIVSLVCFVASIICLILTLLTYVIFPVLRTEAGINNMFLSGSLLLAQVSLLASSHSVRASTLCTALGVLTHFLWLWNFTWSFICSYHMFRVFASDIRSPTTNEPRKLWMTITCSILFPTLIIVTTVVFNCLKSGGQDIGYGRSVCYLNTAFLVGVSMIGPLSAITVLDILFFAVTVQKIHKAQNLQSLIGINDQNNYWYVYIRLSSVTGAFWTVAILASFIDSVVLRILSTILNGLQGVAIFISFICNRRVMSLYREVTTSKQMSSQEEHQIQTRGSTKMSTF